MEPINRYSRRIKILLIALLLLFVAVSRFAWLSEKPYHHDESQYAASSYYLSQSLHYKYDPILHGPFLFYLNTAIYKTFGDNDFSARSGCAFFGILVAVVIVLMSRVIGFLPAVIMLTGYAISPYFTYYNRFLFHDTYVTFFSFLFVYSVLAHIKFKKPAFIYLAASAAAFLITIKINAYIFAFIFSTFAVFVMAAKFPADTEERKKEYLRLLKGQFIHLLLATLLAFFIVFTLFSSFFANLQGFYDGLFMKSLSYWANQHAIERIKGDFDYHIPILAIYELPWMIIVACGIAATVLRSRKDVVLCMVAGIALILLWAILRHCWHFEFGAGALRFTTKEFCEGFLHMQRPYHIPLAAALALTGAIATARNFYAERLLYGFSLWWLFMSLFIYSYAGEKVPWLGLYIVVPMIFSGSLVLTDLFNSQIFSRSKVLRYSTLSLLAIAGPFTLYNSYRVAIATPADPRERLVYVQTTEHFRALAKETIDRAESSPLGYDEKLFIKGEAVFPSYWYFRRFRTMNAPAPAAQTTDLLVVTEVSDDATRGKLKESHSRSRMRLREWWIPDTRYAGLRDLIRYYFFRKLWNPKGGLEIAVYRRK